MFFRSFLSITFLWSLSPQNYIPEFACVLLFEVDKTVGEWRLIICISYFVWPGPETSTSTPIDQLEKAAANVRTAYGLHPRKQLFLPSTSNQGKR